MICAGRTPEEPTASETVSDAGSTSTLAALAEMNQESRAIGGPLATVKDGQPRLLRSIRVCRSAALTAVLHTPSKLVLPVHDPGRWIRLWEEAAMITRQFISQYSVHLSGLGGPV